MKIDQTIKPIGKEVSHSPYHVMTLISRQNLSGKGMMIILYGRPCSR